MGGEKGGMSETATASLVWAVWPASQRPALAIGVGVLILGLSLGATAVYGSGWYGFITLGVMATTLAPFYFPTQYVLNGQTVRWHRVLGGGQRPWAALRAWWDLGDRVLLGPGPCLAGWLARKRGVTLLLGSQREAVVAELTRRLGPPAGREGASGGDS